MDSDHVLKKVHEELQRRFRIAGRGAVSRVQEELQLGAGYFRDLRRPGRRRFDLRVLLDALEALQVDPAEFFSTVFGTLDPISALKAETKALIRQQKRPPRILELLSERDPELIGEPRDLDTMDSEFRDHPRQVRQRAMAWIHRIERSQIPRLLGIYGSACRVSVQLEVAQIVMVKALEMAEAADDFSTQGEILQRCAYVLAARSEYNRAMELTEKAIFLHARAQQPTHVGKTLTDLAIWHEQLDNLEEARDYYLAALDYLPVESKRQDIRANRYSCLGNLGWISMALNNLEAAHNYVRQAKKLSEEMDVSLKVKAVWLEARIIRREGRYERAESLYKEAIDVFRGRSPLDVAVLSVELAQVQLLQQKVVEAYSTAKAMTHLLFPLERNPIAAAAITELIRCALEGRGLTVKLLDRVAQDLSKENSQSMRRQV